LSEKTFLGKISLQPKAPVGFHLIESTNRNLGCGLFSNSHTVQKNGETALLVRSPMLIRAQLLTSTQFAQVNLSDFLSPYG